jgi:transposase
MDLHRRRSVPVRMTEDGRKLETARIDNSPAALRAVLARAGSCPRVVVEATCGWYWAADTLAAAGAEVHLAHPLGVRAFTCRRVKNDERDCTDLADLLRMGRLAEAWIAPPAVRELRELTRYRVSWCGCSRRARTRCTRCWPSWASRCPARTCSAPSGRRGRRAAAAPAVCR